MSEFDHFSRRNFLSGASTIAAGFALATQPLAASLMQTDDQGLEQGDLKISTSDQQQMPVYYARPKGDKIRALPAVIVIHEIFGVHEHIRDLCRRLAHVGYYALAPELYFRQGDPKKYANVEQLLKELVVKIPDDRVLLDIDDVVQFAQQSGANKKRIALTGFCWGGRIAWLAAAYKTQIKAAVAWYGRLTGDKTAENPQYPMDIVAQLKIPVLGLYGGKDTSIPLSDIEKMQSLLIGNAQQSKIVLYPNAQHGFNADYRPSYNPAAAQDAWQKMLAWFKRCGV